MKMRNYMKKREENVEVETLNEELEASTARFSMSKKKMLIVLSAVLFILPMAFVLVAHRELNNVSLGEEGLVQMNTAPIAATTTKKSVISIPSGTIKANPFLPYRNLDADTAVSDVPELVLLSPPEAIDENSDAARVMDTIVSGILYDKFSPSAILNIEGNDYLVKKGDVVNNYKVLNIMQDSVTVKLGSNTYKAGIGEILTEGSLNHNDVSNLSNKFGGVQ